MGMGSAKLRYEGGGVKVSWTIPGVAGTVP